ncbi:MAG: phosphoribosyltransferase [Symploca sp. SIO3C6]|uniref:Phosphoribosyltransferase n=1 Tax=Symploca sp. SIO1C4 TaxID=2607765 RepID=A0A6B3N361_9CYAN|nr:phosphoribosyltransferase [Symploca sp. SIO3C6]NER28136.1 phosphoribosyltransferase [Symploca sp. SIO1C4]NET03424.1 phosphoribosyltransferase [Symploca sp. SIO2B6]NET49510.1 phosphoribosyltransferase [Merismopedia sp. SIO2A8]
MKRRFKNRTQAGQLLAKRLIAYAHRSEVIVLALPRGGVPVAFEVAKVLNAPLDICLVRKLGVPGHKELAMGAIAMGGAMVINEAVVTELGISTETINRVAFEEQKELERRHHAYRGNRRALNIEGRKLILIDDGIATGSTLRAALATLQQQQPVGIIVAVPVAPPSICNQLELKIEKVVCLKTPHPLYAIGIWYEDFLQTTDEEVRNLLAQAPWRQESVSR